MIDNMFELFREDEMCAECREGYPTQTYTPRAEGDLLPDPNDGAICRRCATRLRTPVL